ATFGLRGPCPGKTARVVWLRDIVAHIPLVAEPHADDFKLTFGSLSQYQYARSTGARFGADFDVGVEPAIVGCGSSGIVLQPRPPKVPGEYRIALYVPVSFHMLWDLADPSVPIINNDYRFSAAMIKGIAALPRRGKWPTQIEWRWKVYGHESTHLGDELTIAAQDSVLRGGPVFRRVNVSHWYTEPAVGFMWDEIDEGKGTFELRFGANVLVNANGYYGDSATVTER